MVTDGRRPVTGLTAANFEVKDNGVVQQITEVQYETLPLNVICALDVSSSVSGEPLARLKTALAALIDALADRDRAALLTFSGAVHLHSPLTNDRRRLRALSAQMTAGGTTSFYDAAFAGLALREADNGRTMLLLFSDGDDTSSWLSARKLIAAARQADVVIYPVTIPAAAAPPRGNRPFNDHVQVSDPTQRPLEALAADSGGRVFFARDDDSLTQTFLSVLAEFRQRYVLTVPADGRSRRRLARPRRQVEGEVRTGEIAARLLRDKSYVRARTQKTTLMSASGTAASRNPAVAIMLPRKRPSRPPARAICSPCRKRTAPAPTATPTTSNNAGIPRVRKSSSAAPRSVCASAVKLSR